MLFFNYAPAYWTRPFDVVVRSGAVEQASKPKSDPSLSDSLAAGE
jgi:hypothetical protein